MIFVSIIIIIL